MVDQFRWLSSLGKCPQDPIHHAEGDVLTHLGMVMKELIELQSFRDLPELDRNIVFAGTLLHDIAKPACTHIEEDGRVRSPGHAVRGVYHARRILADDPAFGPLGTPFQIREQVLGLVRWHGLPGKLLEKTDPLKMLLRASFVTKLSWIRILAEADHRGRICPDMEGGLLGLQIFEEYAREQGIWDEPFLFANDHSRFHYFRTEGAHPSLSRFDDCHATVIILSGLPGSGKSTWLSRQKETIGEVISLDDLREELDVEPTENQSEVIRVAYERYRNCLRKRQNCVWNATNTTRMMRDRLINLATDYNARVVINYFEPPISQIRQQNRERSKPVPQTIWEKCLDHLDVPNLTEAHQVEVMKSTDKGAT
jgi:putative nucleotidyltransferase with HDIG domain